MLSARAPSGGLRVLAPCNEQPVPPPRQPWRCPTPLGHSSGPPPRNRCPPLRPPSHTAPSAHLCGCFPHSGFPPPPIFLSHRALGPPRWTSTAQPVAPPSHPLSAGGQDRVVTTPDPLPDTGRRSSPVPPDSRFLRPPPLRCAGAPERPPLHLEAAWPARPLISRPLVRHACAAVVAAQLLSLACLSPEGADSGYLLSWSALRRR